MHLLRTIIQATLLYGAKAWTIKTAMEKKINAFVLIRAYRRLLQISYAAHVTNAKVLAEELTYEREQERDEFQKELGKLHEMIKEKEKVQNIEKELNQQVEALEEQLIGQMAEQNQHDFHKESLINELNHTQNELRNTKESLSNLESQLELKNDCVERLEQQIQIVLSHNCEFQEELNSEIVYLRQNSVSPSDKEDSELINRVTSLNDQVKQLKLSLSIFEDFKAQLQPIHQKIDHSIKSIQDRQSCILTSSSDVFSEKCEKIRSPSTEDLRDISSPDDVHRLDDKIECLLSISVNIILTCETLKTKLDSCKAEKEIESKKYINELSKKDEFILSLKKISNELEENLTEKMKAENQTYELQESKKKLSQMSKQLESTVQKCDEQIKEKLSFVENLRKNKSELKNTTEELSKASTIIKSLEDGQLTYSIDFNDLNTKLNLKEDECADLQDKLKNNQEKLDILMNELAMERETHLLEMKKIHGTTVKQGENESNSDITHGSKSPLNATINDPESCNSSMSVSIESIENWLPKPLIQVLSRIHDTGIQFEPEYATDEEGEKLLSSLQSSSEDDCDRVFDERASRILLTLSELETLRKHLSPIHTSCSSDQKSITRQIFALNDEIITLKNLLSQVNSQERNDLKVVEMISKIFSLERTQLAENLEPHVVSDSCTHIEKFRDLKERLNMMESCQKTALEKLLPSLAFGNEINLNIGHPDHEYYQEEQRNLTKQFAALEQQASINEWKLKREIKLLWYKLEKEKVLVSKTQDALNVEKARLIELTAVLNQQRNSNAHLSQSNSVANIEFNKIKKSLERSRQEISELRVLLDTEKKKYQSIVQVLESERSNFNQLQEAVDSERRLNNITESRHQALIKQLRDTIDSERSLSLQLVHKQNSNREMSEGLIYNESDASIIPEKFRRNSRNESDDQLNMLFSNTEVHLRNTDVSDQSSKVPYIDASSSLKLSDYPEKKALIYLSNQLSAERKNHKQECEKLNESIQQSIKHIETNKQEEEILHMRLNEMEQEKDKFVQIALNLQRDLEACKISYKEAIESHNSFVNKQSNSRQDAEMKLEELRQQLRDLELDSERKSQDIKIFEMKLDGSNEQQDLLKEELDIANERIKILNTNSDNVPTDNNYQHLYQLESIRQKLAVLAAKCQINDPNVTSFKELTDYIYQLNASQVDQFSNATDFTKKLIDHNHELTSLVSKLSSDKIELRDNLFKLEESFADLRQNQAKKGKTKTDNHFKQVLATERSAFAQEQAELHLALHRAQMELHKSKNSNKFLSNSSVNQDDLKACYLKFLRSESFRKALVYQKKFLLILLGGYKDTENVTLSMLTKMGAYPSSVNHTPVLPSSQSRAFLRFRSCATVIIAIRRMKFLVRRWENIANKVTAQHLISSSHRFSKSDQVSNCTSCGSFDIPTEQVIKSTDLHMNSPVSSGSRINSQDNVKSNQFFNSEKYVQRLHSLHSALGFQSSSGTSGMNNILVE
ncbi:A-kinase anchor protein 9 [Nymphon striatum]|nr:A-kinase anchor protein 9 [Nymphon striatum]